MWDTWEDYNPGADHYCYSKTFVLKNKLGIKNEYRLNQAERELSTARVADLPKSKHYGEISLERVQEIHKTLFKDIYEWAGELRSINLKKENVQFVKPEESRFHSPEAFTTMKRDFSPGMQKQNFAAKAAKHFNELNKIHHFREGNGRTLRNFFKEIGECVGFALDFASLKKETYIDAVKDAFKTGNVSKLEIALDGIIKPLELTNVQRLQMKRQKNKERGKGTVLEFKP